jgi:hypothetical protein
MSMVLRFFGGLVSEILATILGTFVIGFGSYLILFLFGLSEDYENVLTAFFSEYGVFLGAIAGTILGLAGLAWLSFRRRAWMLLWGGITAAALEWAFAAYVAHEFFKAPI